MTTLRIYGDELDEPDTFIDCTVDEITLDKQVHLTDDDSDRTWVIGLDSLSTVIDEHAAVKHSELPDPDHSVWDRLSGAREELKEQPFGEANNDFDTMIKNIFVAVIRTIRNTDTTQ